MKTSRKLLSIAASASVALGALTVLATGPAQAVAPGILKINPKTGDQSTLIDFSTQAGQACAVGTSSIQILITGTDMTADDPGIINGNTDYAQVHGPDGNIAVAAGFTMANVFAAKGISAPSGVYTFTLQCLDENLQMSSEFALATTWTPTSGVNNGTYVAASTGVTTGTALVAGPADPVAFGTSSTLSATVTPAEAVGKVQFKSNGVNVGALATITGGVATFNGALPAGTTSLTAQFVPTDADDWASSTSAAVPYLVAGPATITGTARVGSTMACTAPGGGTRTYEWKRNGVVIAGLTTASAVAPAAWAKTTIACAITTTKDATSVTQPSAGKVVALGLAPRLIKRPAVLGTARVGKVLTCSKGTWSPVPSAYTYKWYRGTKVIGSRATYKAVRADKGKLLSCKVTTVKAGYTAGVAKSAARKIR